MRAPALVALLLAAALAGCVDEPAPAAPTTSVEAANATATEAPRDVAAFEETNATEDGLGGIEHSHDYWLGRDRVVVLEDDVYLAPLPVFQDGGTARARTFDLQPPRPNLVYEGTATLEVLVARATATGAEDYPAPAMRLEYRTAADAWDGWRDGGAVVVGTPTVVPVAPLETDMPHSTASLWTFRLVGDGPHTYRINLTITAVRGADVPPWPGHPDLYAETHKRLVYDSDASNREVGLAQRYVLYGDDRDWRYPDKVVSWGTGHLEVFVNITRIDAPVPPDSAYLRVRNATQIYDDFEIYFDADGDEDLTSYRFEVPVDPAGMDSPYAPSSRWAFSLAVGYQRNAGAVFPSTVDYHITIWAYAAEDRDAAKGS